MRQEAIKAEVDRLNRALYEVENEDDIDRIEQMAAANREKMKSRPAVVKRRWRPKPKKGRRR